MIKVTIRQMIYFDALARTLHFGRAAELAGVTQPALSSQIAEMESRLGCLLFERGARGVQLTDEALAVRPRIERILADTREMEALARRGRRRMQGRFRLGIIPTVAPYMLPHILPELKSRFPLLTVDLRETVTQTLIAETTAGRIDGFVAALPLDHPGLVSEALFDDRFFLAVPAAEPGFEAPPVPPESPALERLMLLEEGHCMREQALAVCGGVRLSSTSSFGATSLTTLLQMVGHGLGVTLIPEMAVAASGRDGTMRVLPFAEPMPHRTVAFAWRRNSARHEECVELAAILRALRPAILPAGSPGDGLGDGAGEEGERLRG